MKNCREYGLYTKELREEAARTVGGNIVKQAVERAAIESIGKSEAEIAAAKIIAAQDAAQAAVSSKLVQGAKIGAEVATMPVASAIVKGEPIHLQDFTHAALLMTLMHVSSSAISPAYQAAMVATRDVASKLEDAFLKYSIRPDVALGAAKENPAIMEDLLSMNKDIPDALKPPEAKATEEVAAREPAVEDDAPAREMEAATTNDILSQQGEKRQKFDASPMVTVTGKEMGEIPKFKKFRDIKEFVTNWIAKQTGFFRNDYSNTDTGWDNIALTPKGIDNTLQHSAGPEKIQTIPSIPELIKNGVYLESPKAHDPAQKNMTSHMFAAKVDIDGKQMVVGFVIKEDPATGRRFYDHELTEMQSLDDPRAGVTSKKELTDDLDRQGDVMNIVRKHLGVNPDFSISKQGTESARTPETAAGNAPVDGTSEWTNGRANGELGNIPPDLDQKLAILERQMNEGEVGQRFQRDPEDDQSWDGVKSTNPAWLKEGLLFKAGKAGVRRVIEKARAGKKLTARQERIWEKIQEAAEHEWNNDHEAAAAQEYDKAAAAGIDLHEPRKIAVGDLKPGDQVVIEEKGVPDLVTHQGFDEDGNAILKDGATIHADPFKVLTSIGEKKAGGQSGTFSDTYAAPRSTGHAVPIDPNKPVLPADSQLSHKDATPISSVIDALGKAFDVPIRIGKFRERAHGIFKQKPEVIRLKVANSIKTAVHEVGHHLQNTLFGEISWKPLEPFRSELEPIATKPRAGQSSLPEGFAEFVAKYVVNPAEAQQVAPRFYAHFESLMDERAPELKQALLDAREGVRKWAEQPAALEVLSHINIDGGQGEGILSLLSSRDTWDRVYTNIVDRLFPLKKAEAILTGGEELPADQSVYMRARLFAGVKGKGTHFILNSPFKFSSGENVGKPLAATLRAVENLNEFRSYLVSRRGLELEGRGINAGVRADAMRATVEQFRDKYEHLAVELDEYQEHLTNYLVDAGLVSEEAAATMRELNKNYVPFFRLMEDGKGSKGGGRGLQAWNPLKRIKGSGRDIIDPLESIIKNTYAYIEAAEKNAIGVAFTDLAERQGAGWLVEKLPQPKEAVRISKEELGKTFLKELDGIDPALRDNIASMLSEGEAGEMATFWQNARNIDKKNQIAVYREGKREVFQVAPEIAEVFHDLRAETTPLLIKFAAYPARLLRAGATLTPDFMVRNLIRDAIDAGVISRSGFIPGLDTARGFKHAVTRDETYWNWVKAGGDQASLVSMDRITLQKTLKDITETGYLERVRNVVRHPVEALRILSEISEQSTRLGEFGKAVQKHGSDRAGLMRAAFESRDLLDFSRRGRLMGAFSTVTAFLNASVQGLDRMGRGAIENPKRFLVRAALYIAVPSVLNAIRNYGDEDVANVNHAQRDMFWIVPVGEGKDKTILRIPKPFENGVLFGSSLERATEFVLDAYNKKYDGDLNKARQEAFRGLGQSTFDIAMPNVFPTIAVPFIEHFANRSTAFNTRIIPANREGLLPELQYTPYTTELMKRLSRYVGGAPLVGEMNTFSPAMAENYLRAWTGGLGMYTLQALDAAGRNASLLPNPVKPANTLADTPFVRAFIIRHPSMSTESIERFYDSYNEASKYLKSINYLKNDISGYKDVSNLIPYSVYQALEGPHKMIGDITKAIDIISKDPSGTPDEKRQKIDSLYFRANQAAKLGNQTFDALQDNIIAKLKERAAKEKAR
jgi:hypothetical protein